jgi:hypothetical protein
MTVGHGDRESEELKSFYREMNTESAIRGARAEENKAKREARKIRTQQKMESRIRFWLLIINVAVYFSLGFQLGKL